MADDPHRMIPKSHLVPVDSGHMIRGMKPSMIAVRVEGHFVAEVPTVVGSEVDSEAEVEVLWSPRMVDHPSRTEERADDKS